jgi:type IV pilus assembly protein PilC
MAEFLVKIADDRGHMLEQVESATTATEVRDRLAMQGYLVYEVKQRGVLSGGVPLRRRRKVKQEQFLIFNSQFLTLIRAGLPILTALELLSKQQKNPFFKSSLEDVRRRVKAGESLSHAFDEQHIASRIYSTTLLAGERSGNLEETLKRYIDFERVSLSFKKRLKASLVYPALLVGAMVILLSVLIFYVVPQFATLYSNLGAELPAVTQSLLAFGKNAQTALPLIVLVIAAIIFGFLSWQSSEAGGAAIDRLRMRLPLFGPIWVKYQIGMVSRTLSTLLSGGLPLVSAIETAAASVESKALSQALQEAGVKVREGRPLATSLEETQMFPELAIGMVEVGESTGALPQMLNSVAEFYEEDVQTALSAALSIIEPVILIIMGGVVATVLIALYLPIFNLGAAAAGGSGAR